MAVTYTPTTNFGAKDSLPQNDPDKVIKGSEFTTEFTAIQTAFSLAAPNASPTFTGTVTIPTADINGGNIDGTVIGAATPAAGSFTNLTATGTTTLAGASTTADITFGDNAKAIFGAGSDLQIYHDGINSYIDDAGTGGLFIRSNEFLIQKYTGEAVIYAVADGAVNLYYDNAAKLATTATGIDVTGTVTADGLTVDANSTTGAVKIQSGDNNTFGAGRAQLALGYNATDDYQHFVRTSHDVASSGNKVELLICDGTQNNTITSGSNRVISLAGNGDISFYEDTGTTPKFFWDASAEALGLGTTSPNGLLETNSTGDNFTYLRSGDANTAGIIFGNQSDSATASIQMLHSDNSLSIRGYNNNERMRIDSSGNVGIGVVPDTWSGTGAAIQLAGTGHLVTADQYAYIGSNFYYNAGWKYTTSSTAAQYRQDSGSHQWLTAASGTADAALTWSEAMRINSSGGVSIGTTTSPSNADLLVQDGIAELSNHIIHKAKYIGTLNAFNVTILTITVPVDIVAYYIEATYVSSRAPNSSPAQSRVSKESYFIARNGSGTDVVLTSNLNSADYEVTTTTAGGSFTPEPISAAILRGGAEANTAPQDVVIQATVGDPGTAGGQVLASFKIMMIGTRPTIS